MLIEAVVSWNRFLGGRSPKVVLVGDVLDLPRNRALGIVRCGFAKVRE